MGKIYFSKCISWQIVPNDEFAFVYNIPKKKILLI